MPDGVWVDGVFLSMEPPTDQAVGELVCKVAERVICWLEKRGILCSDDLDPLVDEQPAFASLVTASLGGGIAFGERAGQRLRQVDENTSTYELKRPFSDGTTHVVFSACQLLQRVAALVPPPRFNLTRFARELGAKCERP